MPTVDVDGVAIHYEVDQPDEAVVFVQGLGYGRWMWRWQREAVREEFRTIVPDNRGTGRSDTPGIPRIVRRLPRKLRSPLILKFFGYAIAEMAADLEAVLADVGVRHVHLIGASMGGMIAQEYAIEYDRADSLTLFATTPGGEQAHPVPEETQEQIFARPKGADEREIVRHRMRPAFSEDFYTRHPRLIDRIVEWRLEQDADEVGRLAQAAAVLGFDAHDRLPRIDVPTLIMHGSDDRVVPVENAHLLSEAIPDSELVELEGGPHLFFIEDDETVNDRLLEFLFEVR